MLSDTTAPAEELQDKLTTLRAVCFWHTDASPSAFPVASTAAFWPRSAPVSCPPALFSFTSPRRSSARPSKLRLSDPLTDKPVRSRILSSPYSIFRSISCSSPRLPATTPIAATTASAPALLLSSTTPSRWAFPPSSMAAMQAIAVTTAPACVRQKSSAYAHPLWRSAYQGRRARAAARMGLSRLEPAGGSMSCHPRPHGRGAYAREGRFNPRLRGLPARS